MAINLDRLSDTLACSARLVLSYSDEQPFFAGTCFRASFHEKLYIITARHCLDQLRIENWSECRIEALSPNWPNLRCTEWHRYTSTDKCDTDCGDFAFFEVNTSSLSDSEIRAIPKVCLHNEPKLALNSGSVLVIEGYPTELGRIDYENRRLESESLKIAVRLVAHTPYRSVSQLEFLQDVNKAHRDGLSGSPVFLVTPEFATGAFAGMLIREHFFLRGDTIISELRKTYESYS